MRKLKDIIQMGWIIGLIIIAVSTVDAQGTLSLPQTGQNKCYHSKGDERECKGTGQDGETRSGVEWPEPRFTNPDGSTPMKGPLVLDQLTGLQWMRDAGVPTLGPCMGGPMQWPQAMDYVKCLNQQNYLGYSDWRFPNLNELESMINEEAPNPAAWLNTQGFLNVASNSYWTSTASGGTNVDVWAAYFLNGLLHTSYKWTYRFHVWPVRTGRSEKPPAPLWKTGQTHTCVNGDDGDLRKGIPWPDPRFTDHGDGTVTDHLTGLMWTKESDSPGPPVCNPPKKTWQAALDYAACLNTHHYLGYADWRLPNRKELFSLIDYSHTSPALPEGNPFLNEQRGNYWSSTTFANAPDYAWAVNSSGRISGAMKSSFNKLFIWPVRTVPIHKDGIDLTGIWESLSQTCRKYKSSIKCKIQGTFTIQNIGTDRAPSAIVKFYFSDAEKSDGKEVGLKQVTTGRIKPGGTQSKTLTCTLPPGEKASGKYIIAVINPDHGILETNKKNNTIAFGPIP